MSKILEDDIEKCIKSLIEKFLKWPYNFFTESDAHSYLYYYFFRFGSRELKQFYPTKDSKAKTVLIHREYPTSFRYHKKNMQLDEQTGGREHYDLVVLNPKFIASHTIDEVIAKDYTKCCKDEKHHLLAAVEFKLIIKPLSKNMKIEIEKDFQKLSWAIESGQSDNVYMIIFNRARKEENFIKELHYLKEYNPKIKGIYLESIVTHKRYYLPLYLNESDWKYKITFKG